MLMTPWHACDSLVTMHARLHSHCDVMSHSPVMPSPLSVTPLRGAPPRVMLTLKTAPAEGSSPGAALQLPYRYWNKVTLPCSSSEYRH